MSDVPFRGDVINIDFNIQKGPIEIKKVRPALVLSPSAFNGLNNTAVVCPITSKERKSEFHVKIESDDVEEVYTKNVRDGVEHSFIVANLFTTMEWEPGKLFTKKSSEKGNLWCYLNAGIVDEVSRLVDSILNQTETDRSFIPLQGAVVNIEGILPSERQSALVLSASELNYWKRLFTICPISDKPDSEFAVEIPDGIGVNGFILADQVKSWDWWYRDAYEEHSDLPESTFKDVRKIVRSIIWGAPS